MGHHFLSLLRYLNVYKQVLFSVLTFSPGKLSGCAGFSLDDLTESVAVGEGASVSSG